MNPRNAWQRLAAEARRAPDARDTAAPPGFAARVAALGMAPENRPEPLFEQFSLRVSLRVLGAAAALAVVAAGASYPAAVKLFSNSATQASSSSNLPPAGSESPNSGAVAGIPASDAPGAASSSGDDPVADLVDMVS